MARRLPSPLTNTVELRRKLDAQREGEGFGDLVRFGAEDLEVEPAQLKSLLQEHGIGEEWSPVDIRPKTAARKAITRLKPWLERNGSKVLIRPVKTQERGVTRYAIVEEHTDSRDAKLDYSTANQLVFVHEDGEISFTQQDEPKIREAFEHLCSTYTQREVLLMVRNILEKNGAIKFGDGSGLWFVHAGNRELVDGLKALFLGSLDNVKYLGDTGKVFFQVIGITSSDDSQDAVATFAVEAAEQELEALSPRLDRVISDPNVPGVSVKALREKYRNVLGQMELHKEALKEAQEELAEVEEQAKEDLQMLTQVLEEQTASAP